MKLGLVTKHDKKNKKLSKKFDDDFMLVTVMSFLYFQFMANVEQCESCILNSLSIKLTFSIIVTFYIAKNLKNI